MKAWSAALALVGASLGARGAEAQPAVTLRWSAPSECPSRAAVEAEVSRLLAGTKSDARPVAADATVTHAGDAFRLRLEISQADAKSAREIDGRTCLALAHAAALMVAMTVDPDAARSAAPPVTPLPEPAPAPPPAVASASPAPGAPGPSPPPGPAAALPPGPAAPPPITPGIAGPEPAPAPIAPAIVSRDAPAERSRRPVAWRLFGGAIGDVGTIGAATGAFEIGAALLPRPLRFDLAVGFWPVRHVVADGTELSADIDMIAGEGSACLAPPALARAVGRGAELDLPCVGIEVGRMHAASVGADRNRDGTGTWVATRIGAGGALALAPWLAARLRIEALLPLARPRFHVGEVTIHEPGVAGRAAVTLEIVPGGPSR